MGRTGLFQNIRVYWLAFVVYWGFVLFGYDTGVSGGVVSQPYFRSHFGITDAAGNSNTQKANNINSNVVSVLQAGAFFGALGSAPLSDVHICRMSTRPAEKNHAPPPRPSVLVRWDSRGFYFLSCRRRSMLSLGAFTREEMLMHHLFFFSPAAIGRKWSLFVWSLVFSVGAILQTIAGGTRGLGYVYSGRVIAGIGVGAISAVAPTFVSECAPKEVRARLTGLNQVMIGVGLVLSYFINFGVSAHVTTGYAVWRIPFGFQLVPAGLMSIGLLTVKESPRWLASVGHIDRAFANLAYLRRLPIDDSRIRAEMAEIEAAMAEEREARKGMGGIQGVREAFLGKGNGVRFVIAIVIFVLQNWNGQNSVGYYAPQIFSQIGYTGTTSSLLASGIYGIMKLLATTTFVFFLFDSFGRKYSLFISSIGMGVLFFIIGALLKEFPPPKNATSPPPASKAMAAMLYIYVVLYSMGWGPLPWVYVSDIFPTRTRHYGLAIGSASQWVSNFTISKATPTLQTELGYKMFLMFGAIDLVVLTTFSLLIPETKGRSLEEMDIIFGAVQEGKRRADIAAQERALQHDVYSPDSELGGSGEHEWKV